MASDSIRIVEQALQEVTSVLRLHLEALNFEGGLTK